MFSQKTCVYKPFNEWTTLNCYNLSSRELCTLQHIPHFQPSSIFHISKSTTTLSNRMPNKMPKYHGKELNHKYLCIYWLKNDAKRWKLWMNHSNWWRFIFFILRCLSASVWLLYGMEYNWIPFAKIKIWPQ